MNLFASENLARFTRRQAALTHLGLSGLIAATVVAVMLLLWYPDPWFAAAGGWTLLMLIVGVDVVLGPLLTFVVFDPAKKSLVYDLAVIVMLQVAALIYGVHIMASARPAFVVYFRGQFDAITANDVITDGMAEAKLAQFRTVPLTGPRFAAARVPVDPGQQFQILAESAGGGPDVSSYPRYYIPYATASRDAAAQGKPLADLAKKSPLHTEAVAKFLKAAGKDADGLVYLPLRMRMGEMTIVLNKADGSFVGIVPILSR